MMLFAGRRASSRLYLILQNWWAAAAGPAGGALPPRSGGPLRRRLTGLRCTGARWGDEHGSGPPRRRRYCRQHLRGYLGTSALLVAACLDEVLLEGGETEAQVAEEVGPLVGTLAHEIIMALGQLLARYDDLGASSSAAPERAGPADSRKPAVRSAAGVPSQDGGGGVAQITPLLAHLLLLRETGGLATATALSDTVGTRGFVCAALEARLPEEFLEDARDRYPGETGDETACSVRPSRATRQWRCQPCIGQACWAASVQLRACMRAPDGAPAAAPRPCCPQSKCARCRRACWSRARGCSTCFATGAWTRGTTRRW